MAERAVPEAGATRGFGVPRKPAEGLRRAKVILDPPGAPGETASSASFVATGKEPDFIKLCCLYQIFCVVCALMSEVRVHSSCLGATSCFERL